MMFNNCLMPELKIGNFTAKRPIIQGGMGVGISLSKLASAVAKQGGIGVIATPGIGMYEKDVSTNFIEANNRALIKEIKKAKELCENKGIIGVNIMVALTNANELIESAVEGGADIIFIGAGLPLKTPDKNVFEKIKNSKTAIVPIISSAKAFNVIADYWLKKYDYLPDAVVVEGPLAGGHLGFKKSQINDPAYQLENLVKEVIETVRQYEKKFLKKIPVIAAGGIFTGEDIHKFINDIGVNGVQMATRFVATYECDADEEFKKAYLNCKKSDITIIDSPVGLPGRVIKNNFIEDVKNGEKKPFSCPWHCLKTCDVEKTPYCIALSLTNAKKGFMQNGFAFAGANAYRINEIISVEELFNTLEKEYESCLKKPTANTTKI